MNHDRIKTARVFAGLQLLMLVAINAKDETKSFQAYRSEAESGANGKGITDVKLRAVLDALRKKHSVIEEFFANDAGIDLMKQDGDITDAILTTFTKAGIPILSIHDSYIVPREHQHMLEDTMFQAYRDVTGVANQRFDIGDLLKPAIRLFYHPAPKLPDGTFFMVNGKIMSAREHEKNLPREIFDKSDRYRASLAEFNANLPRIRRRIS